MPLPEEKQPHHHNVILVLENSNTLTSLFTRLVMALIILSSLYLRFGPPAYEEVDLINEIIYLLVLPFLLISGTIAGSFLLGMPIRLIPKLFNWWYRHPVMPLLLLTAGIGCCFLSVQPQFIVTEIVARGAGFITQKIPESTLLITGWFVTAFAITHLYPEPLFTAIKKLLRL
ncbi:hypothetical protein [Ferruginibacter profundus]